jgi:hypothetical protein
VGFHALVLVQGEAEVFVAKPFGERMNLAQAIALIRQRWPAVASPSHEEPVFVLAAGWRSGSTMLQRMLLDQCLVWGEPYGSSGLIQRLAQPLERFSSQWPQEGFLVTSPHWGDRFGDKWTANLYPPVQSLLEAQVEFFRTLLAEPSRQRGFARWGLKEVRYGIEHAIYLQWLFPRARFLFLVRNPYDCWASYHRSKSSVLRFWPEELITAPEQFGEHWLRCAEGFCNRFQEVGGLILRYETLADSRSDVGPLEEYLGFPVDRGARKMVLGASPGGSLLPQDMDRLQQVVQPLADKLGYATATGS